MKTWSTTVPLLEVVKAQKSGQSKGIYSVCSANLFVIEACMQQAAIDDSCVLIEATCNQVNQFGGYTGMKPDGFNRYIKEIADKAKFPSQRIVLGGDHLGTNPWQGGPAGIAMEKSCELVRDYVKAGFTKIHIDTSVTCADDPPGALAPEVSAQRAAELCRVAEESAYTDALPVYVIGTEVPIPGGEKDGTGRPKVTQPDEARRTVELFRKTFIDEGLESAWERVIALVIQPGVEFGDQVIFEYDRESAKSLSKMIEAFPGIIYEAHSTDYQRPLHLRQMVEDHFAILKVGPALTFAMREAIFALCKIEEELFGSDSSMLLNTVESVMLAEPKYWQPYYTGSHEAQAFARKYSLSDRIRYYWNQPELKQALQRLLSNLSRKPIPLPLLSQYFPDLYPQIREGLISNEPRSLIIARIQKVAEQYTGACGK